MADTTTDQRESKTRTKKRTFLGQTKASWYIYWICAVASIANMWVDNPSTITLHTTDSSPSFQGFDSGIYSIIISDKKFIKYLNVSGARAGVMASMGVSHRLPPFCVISKLSQSTWVTCSVISWSLGGSSGSWGAAVHSLSVLSSS